MRVKDNQNLKIDSKASASSRDIATVFCPHTMTKPQPALDMPHSVPFSNTSIPSLNAEAGPTPIIPTHANPLSTTVTVAPDARALALTKIERGVIRAHKAGKLAGLGLRGGGIAGEGE